MACTYTRILCFSLKVNLKYLEYLNLEFKFQKKSCFYRDRFNSRVARINTVLPFKYFSLGKYLLSYKLCIVVKQKLTKSFSKFYK